MFSYSQVNEKLLLHIPRIFFFDCCRGETITHITKGAHTENIPDTSTHNDDDYDSKDNCTENFIPKGNSSIEMIPVPSERDIWSLYATLPHSVSLDGDKNGGSLIRAVVSEFTHVYGKSKSRILSNVEVNVRNQVSEQSTIPIQNFTQLVETRSTLSKQIQIKPNQMKGV